MNIFTLQHLREQEEQQAQDSSDQSQRSQCPPVHETKLVNTEFHDNHGFVISGGTNTIYVLDKEGKLDIADVEQRQSAPTKPVEDVEALFRYVHPSVTNETDRLNIHKEIKNAVAQLSLPDLCRYLMNMEKSRGVIYLSKIKPLPAFNELHRMGMPDEKHDGYTYSNFIKHYNVNK